MPAKTCIILTGPTAVGKTATGIGLAQYFNTSIISADSRQCFRQMTIGVAKPTALQLQSVLHYFINSHSIHDTVNAGVFENYALQAADEIFSKNDIAVVVGGTGLYIKAFCEGMDIMPPVTTGIREEITGLYKKYGIAWLQKEVQQKDPLYFSTGEINNPHRLLRALEVVMASGRSIRDYQKNKTAKRPFNIIKIGLDLPREELYKNIDTRVNDMMESGLAAEVEDLIPYKNINALQTVGYKELFEFFESKLTLEDAIAEIKKNTRHYAKRQLTWFKKDAAISWFSPAGYNHIIAEISKAL